MRAVGIPGRVFALALILLLAAIGTSACGNYPQSVFTPAGDVARVQLGLLDLSMWVVIAIGVLVSGLLIYVVVRFSAKAGDDSLPEQIEGNHKLEWGWTIAFCVILAILVIPNLRDTFYVGDLPASAASDLQVTITGHQWWWEMDYPGLGILTANELHIPTGQKVDLALASKDVIHSFWVPALAGKTDLVPGRTNHMWIEADKAGTYYGQCAQFCGTSHANMRFTVVAQSPADFQKWVQTRQHPDVTPQSALAEQGMKDFQTAGCMACHTIDHTSFQGKVGPNLTGIGSRLTLAAGMMDNTDQNLAAWLHDPPGIKPGSDMPNLHLSQDQIQALVAFLRGLK